MRKMLVLIFVLLLLISLVFVGCKKESTEKEEGEILSLMSYNVRCFSLTGKDELTVNALTNRLPRIKDRISWENPDVFGLQECIPAHYSFLCENFPEYDSHLVYRDARDIPEGTPIFWKKDKFVLLDKGAFWHSNNPEEMGPYTYVDESGEHSSLNRITTWVKLQRKSDLKEFYYFNTHMGFDHPEVVYSLDLIKSRLPKDAPVLLSGDFNFSEEERGGEYYNTLTALLQDSRYAEDNMRGSKTYQGYDAETPSEIDFIFYRNLKVKSHRVLNTDLEDFYNFASDHYAVICEFVF